MNTAEAGMRAWLSTAAGRVFAAQHGGPAGALRELYRLDDSDVRAARALQDAQEMTRGVRPDFGEAKVIVRAPAGDWLSGDTADIVAMLNAGDPNWRWQAAPEPERFPMAYEPTGGRVG